MNKYYFINIGAEVIWHPENSDEQDVYKRQNKKRS